MNIVKRMVVAIYVRVSTLEQYKEGYSINEQIERLQKYCEAKGWTVYKVYIDGGYSGANMDRPGLQAMLRDVEAGLFDAVLVYKLDRLSRSQKDTLEIIEVYAGCADFLKAYCEGDEDLDKFIISTVAKTEPLRAPGERGMAADERWFAGVTFEKQKQHRRQMLSATREKLLSWCGAFKTMSEDGAVCVVANDEALKLCKDIEIFDL